MIVIPIGLMLAMVAAGLTLAVGWVTPYWFGAESDPMESAMFLILAFFATGLAATFTLLPAFMLALVAEIFTIRSALIYAALGAGIGLLAYYGADFSHRLDNTTDIAPIGHALELVVAAGIVEGLVYWAIAGRNAGAWRGRSPPAD
jgi:hypothetical protein